MPFCGRGTKLQPMAKGQSRRRVKWYTSVTIIAAAIGVASSVVLFVADRFLPSPSPDAQSAFADEVIGTYKLQAWNNGQPVTVGADSFRSRAIRVTEGDLAVHAGGLVEWTVYVVHNSTNVGFELRCEGQIDFGLRQVLPIAALYAEGSIPQVLADPYVIPSVTRTFCGQWRYGVYDGGHQAFSISLERTKTGAYLQMRTSDGDGSDG